MYRLPTCLLVALLCVSCRGKQENEPRQQKVVGSNDTSKVTAVAAETNCWLQGSALAWRGPMDLKTTVKALTAALADASPEVMVGATDALGLLGADAAPAAPQLTSILSHQSAWARVSAMETLAAIGPGSVPSLVSAIETGEGAIRVRSVLVLGSMEADAKAAIPTLEKIAADTSLPWRGLAAGALARIDPVKYGGRDVGGTAEQIVQIPDADAAGRKVSGEWGDFQGPNRDNICLETGLLHNWPEGGPKLIWQTRGLGHGYSTVAISNGKIFTTGDFGERDKGGRQCVVALNLNDGKEVWVSPIGPAGDDAAYGTPTVDGDVLFAVGTEGDLVCMEAASGQIRWKKSLVKDFGGKIMSKWQFSETPLVDGDRLLCSPGATNAAIVALHKTTGEPIWQAAEPAIGDAGKTGAGYGSMIAAELHGVRQYIQMTGRGVVSVEAETGRFLWGYNRIANGIANIPTPRVRGHFVFVTTGYRTGCALLKILKEGNTFRAEEVYFLGPKDFENHHGGVVLAGNHIYGGSGTNKGVPVCIEMATGKIAWKAKVPQRGSAAVLYADGHVIFRYDRGLVVLAEATPEAFRVKGSFQPPLDEGPAWAYPVIHNKKLYLRHSDRLLCYDVSGEKAER